MFDGKTQSERINPLATSQSRRRGATNRQPFPVRGNAGKPCSLSTYNGEIVAGDDRCRARCSIQYRQLGEGGTGAKVTRRMSPPPACRSYAAAKAGAFD